MVKRFKKNKSFYIYGKNAVLDIVKNSSDKVLRVSFVDFTANDKKVFEQIISVAKKRKIHIDYINQHRAGQLVGKDVVHQRVLAELSEFDYQNYDEWFDTLEKDKNNCVLLLDRIEDPHNFGAIIRTAVAVGVSAIFITDKQQAPVSGAVYKTSVGTIHNISIVRVANLNDTIKKLKKDGFWIYGVDMFSANDGNIWKQKFDENTAFVLGNEGRGISEKTLEACDFVTPIPMENSVESLNVSVAAAVVLYEWKRQVSKEL